MTMPTAAEFARGWYTIEGDAVTGSTLENLTGTLLPMLSQQLADGTPQVVAALTDAVAKSCQDVVNGQAASAPGWAKSVGHQGLFKVMTACIAEQNGTAPTGFTQEVIVALTVPWWKRPTVWVVGVAGVLAAAAVMTRKKKRR